MLGILRLFDTFYPSQITHLCMTPSLFELVINCDLPSVLCITLGGECLQQRQLEIWRDNVKHFVNVYGPTETFWCTAL